MAGRGESPASPRRINVAEKQRQALELRKAGASYAMIAERLGYENKGSAYRAVMTALDRTLREPADELRELEVARLDALLLALWPQATRGDLGAIDRVLRLMERRAKLLGLDAPTQVNVTQAARQEVDRLVEAGVLDPSEAEAAVREAELILRGAT